MPAPPPHSPTSEEDIRWMRRALHLAEQGQGAVEPNPMVGCVIVRDGQPIAEGFHQRFGGPHAERDAVANVPAGVSLAGTTWYVTLEPCCHTGKTPPCTEAVLAARPARVVVAMRDPFPKVDGGGLQQIRAAGIDVQVGVCQEQAEDLNAPYLKRVRSGRPWVIAKWAMTLDGRIATATGNSQWISGEASRAEVHRLRGRCDAVIVGGGTAEADNPTLNARPPGPRTPTRIVVSASGRLAVDSNLVQTIDQGPVQLFASADAAGLQPLVDAGVEVIQFDSDSPSDRLAMVLDHCGAANMTNVLVEGGGDLLGGLFDLDAIDEYHVFIAPRIVGGAAAVSPLGGQGRNKISDSPVFATPQVSRCGDDVYVTARRVSESPPKSVSFNP
ncbi:bifunctional diaminohydroxyphosphoribosylaminopyrimidine deaminase/5-amino-6-(5-phosphoribosylamino)uracil reductase RibD [Roseimaritima ulvae]|uniref:Riboflavin biosynthesis protein RibD n=1 Tax=Roseimaritima ulvae TaxID=980254 RepID=A0A5B9QN42_9BACT|nr:bifunctional diaminohydroxyphosphoribosylaminopyrimidine deaminase/5-amino-6-(5-phosphoribosylamino)uracil reductase RibD [Roseimaritima ulvae]QEG39050.1 Riboflavin biosynthesis protein RibD [Roseimaritima ulvae]